MKLKERMRRDRQMLSELDRHGKLLFIWDYYRLPIIAAVCAVVLLTVSLLTTVRSNQTAMYAVFINAFRTDGDRESLETLLKNAGIDMTGKQIDVSANLRLGGGNDEMSDIQTIQVLAALFGVSGLDFFAADENTFQLYLKQDAFLDLSYFIEADVLEKHKDDLLWHDTEEGAHILAGIRLHDGTPLHKAGYYLEDVVVCVAARAQNMEEAVRFLKQLL